MHPTVHEVERDSAAMLLQALSSLLKEEDAQRVDLAHLLHKDMAGGAGGMRLAGGDDEA